MVDAGHDGPHGESARIIVPALLDHDEVARDLTTRDARVVAIIDGLVAEHDRLRGERDRLQRAIVEIYRLVHPGEAEATSILDGAELLLGDIRRALDDVSSLVEECAGLRKDLLLCREGLTSIGEDDELAEEGPAFGLHAYRRRRDQARYVLGRLDEHKKERDERGPS